LVEKYAEDVGMDEDETLALQNSTNELQETVNGDGASEEVAAGEEAASVSGRLMRIAGPPIPTESGVIYKPLAAKKAEKDTDTEVLENDDTDPSNPRLLNVEGIVHTDGLSVYKDQAGRLWTGLATYWIKRGEFDRATATFEQGLATVLTIRDFTQIFDAYAEFSETMISTLMDALADEDNLEDEDFDAEDTEKELDERMKAFEILMDRRPFLVNEVLIRRNPHEVVEWEKRIALYGNNDEKVIETYIKALDTISPRKATGPLYPLYVNFAKFYEEGGSVDPETGESATEPNITEARKIFEKGSRVQFKTVDELAELWCEWAEMELRNE
jgi:pre-mRNA-splicing factor SYF1